MESFDSSVMLGAGDRIITGGFMSLGTVVWLVIFLFIFGGGYYVYSNLPTFFGPDGLLPDVGEILGIGGSAVDVAKDVGEAVVDVAKDVGGAAVDVAKDVGGAAVDVATGVAPVALDVIGGAATTAFDLSEQGIDSTIKIGGMTMDAIGDIATGGNVGTNLANVGGAVVNELGDFAGAVLDGKRNTVTNVIGGLKGLF